LEYGGDVSWIEVPFSAESPYRTRFELEHIAHTSDEGWAEFGPGAVGIGWDMTVMGLAAHLSSGQSADPLAAMAWMGSASGRQFMALASRHWNDAQVASGADPTAAQAAADRTLAAYTFVPQDAAQ
jgi:hypothetical protein